MLRVWPTNRTSAENAYGARWLRVVVLALALCAAALLVACGPIAPEKTPSDQPRFGPLPSGQSTDDPEASGSPDATIAPQGSSAAQPPGKPGYSLEFADEFDGDKVDPDTWAKLTPWRTKNTTGESQYYDPANTVVKDGHLVITSEERTMRGRKYTSGIITSLNRPKFQYGYYEIRSKAPKGQGIWPAFWLTNDATSEIDIFEMLGNEPRRQHSTLHHQHDGENHQHRSEHVGPDLSHDFHIFAVDWQPEHVIWYLDGIEIWRYTEDIPSDPMWIVVNTAIGGRWSGKPDSTTKFPQEFVVDYIRVYERD